MSRIYQRVQNLFEDKAKKWAEKYEKDLDERLHIFNSLIDHKGEGTFLDLGCGTGNLANYLSLTHNVKVTAVDFSEMMVQKASSLFANNSHLQFVQSDIESLSYPSGSFSVVYASSLFEYLDDPEVFIKQARKFLEPGGELVFSVPNPESMARITEGSIKKATPLLKYAPGQKVKNFLEYLRVSKNRLTTKELEIALQKEDFKIEKKIYFSNSRLFGFFPHIKKSNMLLIKSRKMG